MSETKTTGRVVRHLSTAYFVPFTSPDGNKAVLVRTARRGEVIDASTLAKGEEQRLEDLGALLPRGSTPRDVEDEHAAILDLYRGQRGDTEAMSRAVERAGSQRAQDTTGGIVDVTAGGAGFEGASAGDVNVGRLADHISESKLTVDDTVALAENDPERARRVLEAEQLASGGSPRAGVAAGLQKIIDGA